MRYLILIIAWLIISKAHAGTDIEVTWLDKNFTESEVKEVDFAVFSSAASIRKDFKEIAILEADDNGHEYSKERLIKDLRAKAYDMGADAIIIGNSSSKTTGAITVPAANSYSAPYTIPINNNLMTATAIIYLKKH